MSDLERTLFTREEVAAVVRNETTYLMADAIVVPKDRVGRPSQYPMFMLIVFSALVSVFGSARKAARELRDPSLWSFVRDEVRTLFPDDPTMWLGPRPMRRYHYAYGRDRYLVPSVKEIVAVLEATAALQAVELDLCVPQYRSLNHPSSRNMLVGDGKVVAPLWKSQRRQVMVDKETGEIRVVRADPTADHHMTGSGKMAWGNKVNLISVRGDLKNERVILSVGSVEKGAEMQVALDMLDRLRPLLPSADIVCWDGALRGTHITHLMTLGWLTVSPVTAAEGGKASGKPRVEKERRIETVTAHRRDGSSYKVNLYGRGGSAQAGILDEDGNITFVQLMRHHIEKRTNAKGGYRFYGVYRVPEHVGGGEIRVRFDPTDEDQKIGLNRAENLRPYPPGEPDYERLYPRRNDAESINRGLDDTMWLGRAHSVGKDRVLVDLVGFALLTNSVAVDLHRRSQDPPDALAA